MHKSVVLLAALAASGLVAESASAKEMTHCQLRYSFCSERCLMKSNTGGEGNRCLARTCNHQYQACARDSGESSDPYHDRQGMTGPKGGKGGGGRGIKLTSPGPTPPVGPSVGGILESGPVLGSQGPAATGSPVRPPATPPVIIH